MAMLEAIDLFSGSGGTTAGLKAAGVVVKSAVEIDKVASQTYIRNNPEVNLIVGDIREVTGDKLNKTVERVHNNLLLVACPPCQGFSSIRNGGEGDIRNELVFEFLRLIKEMKPEFILMENVSGMSRGKGKEIFKKFYDELKGGYDTVYDILNAADFGVPQVRKRLVVHGVRKDISKQLTNKISLPKPTHSKEGIGLDKWVNADVILGLPSISAGEEYKDPQGVIMNHVANNLSDLNIERIRYIRKNGGSRDSLPKYLIKNWHRNLDLHKDVYGILDINRPSITITGGCMSFSKGRFGHPLEDRALSAREAARLQSFPDNYEFLGTKTQIARQIGNAVPVGLASASGSYFMQLNEEI